jgi:predicted small lipoprotein YifL
MRRALLWILAIGVLTASLTGCGGAGSSITGPALMETPDDER